MDRFDQYFRIEQAQGKQSLNLPYDLRARIHQEGGSELYKAFTLGRTTPEQLQTVQAVYDNWYNATHPTDSDMIQKRNESLLRDNILNTDRKLKRAKAELERISEIVRKDGHVPFGLRDRLRTEIKDLEEQLESYKSLQANTQEKPKATEEGSEGESDWMDSIL